jgi:hypothetical protein
LQLTPRVLSGSCGYRLLWVYGSDSAGQLNSMLDCAGPCDFSLQPAGDDFEPNGETSFLGMLPGAASTLLWNASIGAEWAFP